jgi:glycosyltransferase involved in cell wall biosynthesis
MNIFLPSQHLHITDLLFWKKSIKRQKPWLGLAQRMSIKYSRNEKNLGLDGNFIKCVQSVRGKYVLVLGDDDYFAENSLQYILEILHNNECGVCHLACNIKDGHGYRVFNNTIRYFSEVSYWFTFISANIVKSSFVKEINFDEYRDSIFSLLPLYMTAATKIKNNIIIYEHSIDYRNDSKNNGGYNFFSKFVNNYLTIWKDCSDKAGNSRWNYEKEKYKFFKGLVYHYVYKFLFRSETGKFDIDKGWYYLFKFYWYLPYFYFFLCKLSLITIKDKLLKR